MVKKLLNNIRTFFANLFGSKPEGDPQGTGEIKSVFKNVMGVVTQIKKAKGKDSPGGEKITGIEWLGVGKTSLPLVQNFKRWELFKAQVVDFTTEEGSEMAGWLAAQGIIGDDAKLVVEHTISIIEKGIDIYKVNISEIIRIIQKKK